MSGVELRRQIAQKDDVIAFQRHVIMRAVALLLEAGVPNLGIAANEDTGCGCNEDYDRLTPEQRETVQAYQIASELGVPGVVSVSAAPAKDGVSEVTHER